MDLSRILHISNMDNVEVIVQPHGTLEFPSSTKYFEGKLGQYWGGGRGRRGEGGGGGSHKTNLNKHKIL